ncbi:MAG TPA: hypothetical protein VFA57_18445 [Pseudolabrys sp.]|nr:hypothetical protein [Pseudolabrys sp.]
MVALQPRRRADKALTTRRNLVGVAVGVAAWLSPLCARAQRYTATTISKAAQDARRDAGWLGRRADELLRLTVADGPSHDGRAVLRFRHQQVALARDLATLFNTRVSEDDWLLVVPTRELDLALAMQPLAIRLAPTADEVEAALAQPLPLVEPLPGDQAPDVLHSIVLASLGLERRVALFEQLRNDPALGPALNDAAAAVKAERFGLAALGLERVMRAMVSPATVAAVTDNLGTGARYRLYKAVAVRFVPFIGWTYFVSYLLATIYLNRDTTAAVLR